VPSPPVIRGITVNYPDGRGYKLPGESISIDIDAIDADTHTLTITAVVLSTATGDQATFEQTIAQSDPFAYSATVTPAEHTIVPDPVVPSRFWVT